jgi:hypothetical protein
MIGWEMATIVKKKKVRCGPDEKFKKQVAQDVEVKVVSGTPLWSME